MLVNNVPLLTAGARRFYLTYMRQMMIGMALIVVWTGMQPVAAYSTGAPNTVCSNMMPLHNGVSAQTTTAPYTLTTTTSTYSPGGTVQVTLAGVNSTTFKGYLILARLTTNNTIVGNFSSFPNGSQSTCSRTAATHSSNSVKAMVNISWTAPSISQQGNIVFISTIVQSHSVFWTNVRSLVLTDGSTGSTVSWSSSTTSLLSISSTASTTRSPSTTSAVDRSQCGESKGCFVGDCSQGECSMILTWEKLNHEYVSFELEAIISSDQSWVAFGISADKEMGLDSVIECMHNEDINSYVVQESWNVRKSNELLSNSQLGLVPGSTSAGYINGRIVCRFQRYVTVNNSHSDSDKVLPLTKKYFFMMAKGQASSGSKQPHQRAVVSYQLVDINSFDKVSDSPLSDLIKAHGILMVLAWMVFASFGLLFPRYCKSAWPTIKLGGKQVWFLIHLSCMIIALFMTSAGFIIIFVQVGGFKDLKSYDRVCWAHAPLGIIVMTLVLANPIMAIFRCEPNDSKRTIFNVSHFIVGQLALLAAVVTIFLGLYMTNLKLPMWTVGVMSAYICFHAAIEVILIVLKFSNTIFNKRSWKISTPSKVDSFEMSPQVQHKVPDPTDSSILTIVLFIHLCGVLAFAVAISVQIGLS